MTEHTSAFALGDTVTEKITGITGRVMGICFYETACTHVGIKRLGVDMAGKPHEMSWFDEPMVDRIDVEAPDCLKPNPSIKPGGPLPSGMSHPC